jgi:hypothetical protein
MFSDCFERLSSLIVPQIQGINLIKKSLLLSLMNLNPRKKGFSFFRNSINLLLIGDYNLIKDEIFSSISKIFSIFWVDKYENFLFEAENLGKINPKNLDSEKISFKQLLDYYTKINEDNGDYNKFIEELNNKIQNIDNIKNIDTDLEKLCEKCKIKDNLLIEKNKCCLVCNNNLLEDNLTIDELKNTSNNVIDIMKKYHIDCYKDYLLKNKNKCCLVCKKNLLEDNLIIDELEKNGSSKKLLPFESFLTSTKIVRCFRSLDFACINHS